MNNVETVTSNCGNEEWNGTADKWSADGSGQSANQLYTKYVAWHKRTKQSDNLKDFKTWLSGAISTGLLKKTDKGYFAASGMKHGGDRHAPSAYQGAQNGKSGYVMGADARKLSGDIVYCAGMKLRKNADGSTDDENASMVHKHPKHGVPMFQADAAGTTEGKKKAGFMAAIMKHKVIILTGVGIAIAAVVVFKVVKAHEKKK